MDFDCTVWALIIIAIHCLVGALAGLAWFLHWLHFAWFWAGCLLSFGLVALWPQDCVGYALLVLILAAISWVLDGAAVALVASWL